MIKFIFNGHLFRFFQDKITIITPYGDKYKVELNTYDRDIPFSITLLHKRNEEDDIDQLRFEREMKGEVE